MRPLGDLPGGDFYSLAYDVSGDGAVVVGYGTTDGGEAAFLWDAAHGMRNLRDVLVNEYGLGASLAGWTLSQAIGISADGTTIVGAGYNPAGKVEAWIVSLERSISVTPTSGLVTTEGGGTASFSVVLAKAPTADVTIPVSSSNTAEGLVSASSLTFTPANWNVPQTVTITGVDDGIVDGPINYTILLGAASSADPAYNGLDPADVSVTNTDNDLLTTTFTKAENRAIPDNGTLTSSLVIATTGTISDLNVKLNISHTNDADLDVFLDRPRRHPHRAVHRHRRHRRPLHQHRARRRGRGPDHRRLGAVHGHLPPRGQHHRTGGQGPVGDLEAGGDRRHQEEHGHFAELVADRPPYPTGPGRLPHGGDHGRDLAPARRAGRHRGPSHAGVVRRPSRPGRLRVRTPSSSPTSKP